jgi:hypothetical protein
VLWGKDVEGNQNRGVNFASAALGGNSGVETGSRCQRPSTYSIQICVYLEISHNTLD